MIAPKLKQLDPGRQIEMHVYDQKVNAKIPKYTIHVVDSSSPELSANKKCAALIVPQG